MTARSRLFLVVIALGFAGAGFMLWQLGASGERPGTASFAFQDWIVRCQVEKDATACGMSQQILEQGSGRPVLQLTMGSAPDGEHRLAVVVPLGVSVPDGVTIQIADATRKAAYAQCLPGGCITSLPADAVLLEKLRAGGDARVAIIDRTGKPLVVPFSLKGFGPAFDKMEAKGGDGGSWLPSFLKSSQN